MSIIYIRDKNKGLVPVSFTDNTVTSVNGQTGDVIIEIPEQVQPDWNQNDSTKPDYVNNRTHYEEGSEVVIEWDGNIEGRGSFVGFGSMTYYKVSDVTPALEDLIGSTLSVADNSMTYTESDLAQKEGAVVQCDGVFVVVQQAESFTMTGEETLTAPSNGMYFPSMEGVAITFTYGSTTIHTLDEKFIPDTIARTSDIPDIPDAVINPSIASIGQTIVVKSVDENGKPTEWEAIDMPEQVQSDWSQTDETAPDFIKNKPILATSEEIKALFN